jgi:hypothetical protein
VDVGGQLVDREVWPVTGSKKAEKDNFDALALWQP